MFIQCTHCLHAFDAPSSQVPCPRCGNLAGSPSSQGTPGAPRTMAMDASMVADMMRGSIAAPPAAATPQPSGYTSLGGAPTAPQQGVWHQPPANPGQFAAPPQQFGGFGAPPSPQQLGPPGYGPPVAAVPQGRDLSGHAVVSIVMSALAFLGGGCNLVGLAGVAFGLMAYTSANESRPDAPSKARTARVLGIVALALTVLLWIGVGAFFLFVSDGSGSGS